MSVYLIGGDEPFLAEVKTISLIGKFQLPELNYMTSNCLNEDVLTHLYTFPIMDENRVALVTVQHLKEVDNQCFREYLNDPVGVLVVRFREYDGRSAFYKEMKKLGYLTLCKKEDAAPSLRDYVLKRASKEGVTFAEGALDLFLQRLDYAENDDMNLYGVLGYLHSLSALNKVITADMVRSEIPAHHNENIFGIAEMIVAGDVNGLRVQASLLGANAIGTLSALLREYRIAYKAKYFSCKEIGVSYCRLAKKEKKSLVQGIEFITSQIASLKRGAVGELVLTETFLRLI